MASQLSRVPPYLPTTWGLGGRATKTEDIPITAVFMALYLGSAAWHMTIFQKNNKRGHKFLFGAVLFGFSMSRIITCALRIATICNPRNANLSIAAAVFVSAAVLIIYIINLLWSQRLLRAMHPKLGWHRATKIVFLVLYFVTFCTLMMNITVTVQSFYTLRPRTRFIDRAVQLYGQTFMAVLSSLPYFIVGLALMLPRHTQPEKFGAGKLSVKIALLLAGTSLITMGAWYRCATTWQTPVPRTKPLPAYFAKPAFYIFNFGVEILTVYMYAIMRVDLRFHVPNGAKGPGSYERMATEVEAELTDVKAHEPKRDG